MTNAEAYMDAAKRYINYGCKYGQARAKPILARYLPANDGGRVCHIPIERIPAFVAELKREAA
jgi:hypothetical protein